MIDAASPSASAVPGIIHVSAEAARPVATDAPGFILTPPPPATPRINGPVLFGVRPGAPFLYTIPVTGERPISYAVDGLPAGLALDAATGRITGRLAEAGEHAVVFRATNALGVAEKPFRIVCGDKISLTPAMGWNSWNSWAHAVDQDKVLRSARALVAAGLDRHGWNYINIDDTWQGQRGGPHHAIQGNAKFPDMKRLCDEIHALGLKAGIYSSPWITTYALHRGGGSDSPDGAWGPELANTKHQRVGKHVFAREDATQWAEWGFDYLKYDWNPNDIPETRRMSEALRATGRDIIFSLSNSAPIENAVELGRLANSWRTTGDIWDTWETPGPWQQSVSEIGFNQDSWTEFGGPGHWNDPDMLVLGYVGWGENLHRTKLTPAEQYTHFSLWCLLSSPLLIGCDLERLDAFTLNLLTNDEVIAINQDELGRSARRVATIGAIDVYKKPLADGTHALGFFNRGDRTHTITVKLDRLGLGGTRRFRDLWRQREVGVFTTELSVTVDSHDVMLYKVAAAPSPAPIR